MAPSELECLLADDDGIADPAAGAQKFYAVAGAHADYDFGPVLVSLWGRNLTNTHYNTFAVASSAVGGTHYFAQRATPIQLGFDVNIHF